MNMYVTGAMIASVLSEAIPPLVAIIFALTSLMFLYNFTIRIMR